MLRFATRTLWRRKARTILTVMGIMVGIIALTVLGALASRMNQQVSGATEWFSGAVTVYAEGGSFIQGGNTTYLDRSVVEDLRSIQGVESASGTLSVTLEEGGGPGGAFQDQMMGVDPDNPDDRVSSLKLLEGRHLQNGDEGMAVLGSTLAESLEADAGSRVELKGSKYEVVGVLDTTLTAPDSIAFVSLADAQNALRATMPAFELGDPVSSVSVRPSAGTSQESLAQAIQETVGGVEAVTSAEAEAEISQFSLLFNTIVIGVALLALIVGGISTVNTMVMAVSERTREIGVKKAIGAPTRSILGEVLSESGMIGFWGGATGAAVGVVIVLLINNMTSDGGVTVFTLTPAVVLGPVIFAVLLGMAAGIFPAYRAARLDPVKALKEE